MASVVFDASAILALLQDEPGSAVVARRIGDGMIITLEGAMCATAAFVAVELLVRPMRQRTSENGG